MKRKDFYLFRHGETEYNRLGLRQGQGIDAGLNETGRLQAQKLAVYLEEKEIEVIYTSPLRRARQTAEIAAVRLCIAGRGEQSSHSTADAAGSGRFAGEA